MLQLIGGGIKVGAFSVSLVLIPIVLGTALYGIGAGAWLGLVFGVTVILTGDAAAFSCGECIRHSSNRSC
ncbi:MAG: hypothetical protein L6V88_02460 [Anaerotruncus sp.]|nr:MAG: hypothetical protein L6V88_02460 [Anaerotruncus sp.]